MFRFLLSLSLLLPSSYLLLPLMWLSCLLPLVSVTYCLLIGESGSIFFIVLVSFSTVFFFAESIASRKVKDLQMADKDATKTIANIASKPLTI